MDQLKQEMLRRTSQQADEMMLKYDFSFRHGLPLISNRYIYSPLTSGGSPRAVTHKTPAVKRPKTH